MPSARSKYSPAYCKEVIEFLALGHSVTAFAGEIGVARSTVFEWAKAHPEFSAAMKIGQAKATAYWENILKSVAKDGKGNATAAIFGLKNRAAEDWNDRIANVGGGDGRPGESREASETDVARRIAFTLARATQAKPGN